MNKQVLRGLALVGAVVLSGAASAEVPATATSAISGAATDVAAVGAAVFLVMVGIKLVKWIRRAL